jgi:hypothetical protein
VGRLDIKIGPDTFLGPADLAGLITDKWHSSEDWEKQHLPPHQAPQLHAAISEKGVALLVELLYRASFAKNEGRHVRIRVLVNDVFPEEKPRLILRFDPPLSLVGPDLIRRLAPTIHSTDALLISEGRPGKLQSRVSCTLPNVNH